MRPQAAHLTCLTCVLLRRPASLRAAAEPAAAPSGSWFGGWFSGGKKEEEAKPAAPSVDLSEDRFAPPPMPNFGGAPEPQFR